jgi:hypothetical protein
MDVCYSCGKTDESFLVRFYYFRYFIKHEQMFEKLFTKCEKYGIIRTEAKAFDFLFPILSNIVGELLP